MTTYRSDKFEVLDPEKAEAIKKSLPLRRVGTGRTRSKEAQALIDGEVLFYPKMTADQLSSKFNYYRKEGGSFTIRTRTGEGGAYVWFEPREK